MGITAIGIRKKIKIYAEKYVGVEKETGDSEDEPPRRRRRKEKRVNHGTAEKPPRGRPIRCSSCCMWKTTGPDLEVHTCRKDLYDEETDTRHSYEQCPTQQAEKHPEELQRQMAEKQKLKEEEKKKKQEERQKETVSVFGFIYKSNFFSRLNRKPCEIAARRNRLWTGTAFSKRRNVSLIWLILIDFAEFAEGLTLTPAPPDSLLPPSSTSTSSTSSSSLSSVNYEVFVTEFNAPTRGEGFCGNTARERSSLS
jgi:hypothetical protein